MFCLWFAFRGAKLVYFICWCKKVIYNYAVFLGLFFCVENYICGLGLMS